MGRLDRYVIGMVLTPLIAIQAVAVILLVLEQMLRLVDFVLAESGPFHVIWRMLAFLVPEYVGIALPVGLMLGVVLAVRRLSLAYEMHALQATGFSPFKLLKPVYMVALPLGALALAVSGFVQPVTNYQYSALKNDITGGAFLRAFRVGEFLPIGENATLRIGAIDAERGEVRDIFLERCTSREVCTATTAESGELMASEDGRRVALRLRNGLEINFEIDPANPGLVTFEQQQLVTDLPELTPFRDRGAMAQENTLFELARIVIEETPESFRDYHRYRADLHWRLIMAVFFLASPLLAIPLGVADPRRDTGVGVALSVVSVIVFIEVLETAESFAAEGLSPWLVMWPVLGVFTATSGGLFLSLALRAGGRPLEPIEDALGAMWRGLKKLGSRRGLFARALPPLR